jgi:glycine/D-amino acid oxidase-like deaminating enzyme
MPPTPDSLGTITGRNIRSGEPLNICVIGSGISGLSTAFYLSKFLNVDITVFERADAFGGRANVTGNGEHCPRVFLSNYKRLFSILREVENEDGLAVYETLQPVHRYTHVEGRGWAEISHLYVVLAKELSLAERLRVLKARHASPLVAAQVPGANDNRYGSVRNFSPLSLARVITNLHRSTIAFALGGPTDECLTSPWVRYLEKVGVTFRRSHPVNSITPSPHGVSVHSPAGALTFDAVVVATFVSDAADLLAASGIDHRLKALDHVHCQCLTLRLDPRERIFEGGRLGLYSREGINVVLQPGHSRCVVLCTRPLSTDVSYVVSRVRHFLSLEYAIPSITVRNNHQPAEAIYAADYIRPTSILRRNLPRIYFAGSYIKNSYPIDSGESAARSAFNAVQRIQRDYHLSACPCPSTESRPGEAADSQHPAQPALEARRA